MQEANTCRPWECAESMCQEKTCCLGDLQHVLTMRCTLESLEGFVCDLQRFELTLQDAETKLGRWLSSCDCREVCLAIKIVVSCVAVYCPSCPNQHLHSGCGFAGVPPEPVAAKDSRQRERERERERGRERDNQVAFSSRPGRHGRV